MARFNPSLHPRDRRGRFRVKAGTRRGKGQALIAAGEALGGVRTTALFGSAAVGLASTGNVAGATVLTAAALGRAYTASARARQFYLEPRLTSEQYITYKKVDRNLQRAANVSQIAVAGAILGPPVARAIGNSNVGGKIAGYAAKRAAGRRAGAGTARALGKTALKATRGSRSGVYKITNLSGKAVRR